MFRVFCTSACASAFVSAPETGRLRLNESWRWNASGLYYKDVESVEREEGGRVGG